MKKLKWLSLFMGLTVLCILVTAEPVVAATPIYVNGATGNDSWDGSSEIYISDTIGPKKTIKAGINAVDSGGIVNVAAGTYAGNIVVDKSVTIIGDPGMPGVPGPGPSAPVIDGGNAVVDAFDLVNGVSNVTISGFEIRNLAASDWTDGSGVGVQAWVPSTQNITVSHNWFHNVGYGVMAGNDGSSAKYALGTHTGWTVTDNVFEGLYSVGVELTDTSDSIVSNNIIHLGPVRDPYGFGPIGVFSWAHISQKNLTVSGNTIDGTQTMYPAIYIYAYDDVAPNPNLDGVFIQNNLITSAGTPYQVDVRNISLYALYNGKYGGDPSSTGTVTNVSVTNNNLTRLRNRTAATIDAQGNWWGQTTGPAAGQTSGSVTTCPWIYSFTDDPAKAGQPGFWPNPLTLSNSLTTIISPSGGGTLSCNGAPCATSYACGTVVTVTAVPNSGYVFKNWGDGCNGSGACVITTGTTPKLVTAVFLQDMTPPVITPSFTGTMGSNGWYTSDVTVSWAVSDPESGISSSSGCGPTTLTADSPGTSLMCSATNGANLSNSISVSIKIDKTPPVVTAQLIPLSKGGDDDSEQRFRVVFTSSDNIGVVSTTASLNGVPVTNGQVVKLKLAKKGAQEVKSDDGILKIRATSFTLTVAATDAAGNSKTATAVPVFNKNGKNDDRDKDDDKDKDKGKDKDKDKKK